MQAFWYANTLTSIELIHTSIIAAPQRPECGRLHRDLCCFLSIRDCLGFGLLPGPAPALVQSGAIRARGKRLHGRGRRMNTGCSILRISAMARFLLLAYCAVFVAKAQCNASNTSCTFIPTGALQSFTVPVTGSYYVTANGAQGGNVTVPNVTSPSGGLGATASGEFLLTAGQVYMVAVGIQGTSLSSIDARGAAGGGGSFVVGSANSPLILAGGGGGAAAAAGFAGANGSAAPATTNQGASGSGNAGGMPATAAPGAQCTLGIIQAAAGAVD